MVQDVAGEAASKHDGAHHGAPRPAPPEVRRHQLATLAGTAALIVLGLLWELWLAPTGRGTLALKVLPLALALPGLWRHRMYTYRWLSLVLWLYVLEGLLRATTEGGIVIVLASLETLLAVATFTTATIYIRRRLKDGAGASAGDTAAADAPR